MPEMQAVERVRGGGVSTSRPGTLPNVASNELAALIDRTEKINEWSDRDVARHASVRGHKLTSSDLSLYRRHGMRTLVPAKVRAIAAGLQLPAYHVAIAVLSDLGIDIPLEVRTPERAVELDETIPKRTRDILLGIISGERR